RLIFSPDSTTLAIVPKDANALRLWKMATGRELRLPLKVRLSALTFSHDSRTLAAKDQGLCDIYLWDVTTGQPDPAFKGETLIKCFALAPDGRSLAVGEDRCLRLWDVRRGKQLREMEGPVRVNLGTDMQVAFAPDGKTLLASSFWWEAVRVWDV